MVYEYTPDRQGRLRSTLTKRNLGEVTKAESRSWCKVKYLRPVLMWFLTKPRLPNKKSKPIWFRIFYLFIPGLEPGQLYLGPKSKYKDTRTITNLDKKC